MRFGAVNHRHLTGTPRLHVSVHGSTLNLASSAARTRHQDDDAAEGQHQELTAPIQCVLLTQRAWRTAGGRVVTCVNMAVDTQAPIT